MNTFYVWDLLPILAIAAMIAAFFVKRSRMKTEEKELKETLQALEPQKADTGEDTK